jgi:hypothetical protein
VPITVQGPDGKIIQFPDGTPQEDMLAAMAAHYNPRGFLGAAKDYIRAADAGVYGVARDLASLAGPDNVVEDFFERRQKQAQDAISVEGQAYQGQAAARMREAEGKGFVEELKGAGRAFAAAPGMTVAQGVGSVVPFVAGTLAGGPVAGLALGAASGAGSVKSGIYDATYEKFIEAGIPEEQAKAAAEEAQSYAGENIDQITLGGIIGAIAARAGVEKSVANTLGQSAARAGIVRTAAKSVAGEAGTEAVQEGQGRFATNLAENRAGYDTPLMEGVVGQGAQAAITGGLLGAPAGVAEGIAARPRPEPTPTPEPVQPTATTPQPTGTRTKDRQARERRMAELVNEYMAGGDNEVEATKKAGRTLAEEAAATARNAKPAEPPKAAEPTPVPEPVGTVEPPVDAGRGDGVPDTGGMAAGDTGQQPVVEPATAGLGDAVPSAGEPEATAGEPQPALEPYSPPTIDRTMPVKKRNEAAGKAVSTALMEDPEFAGATVDKKQYNAAKNMLRDGKATDARDALRKVLGVQEPVTVAPEPAPEPAAEPLSLIHI